MAFWFNLVYFFVRLTYVNLQRLILNYIKDIQKQLSRIQKIKLSD